MRRNISAAIAADVKRFCHQTDEVFGTHRRYFPSKLEYWVLRIRHRGHACCIEERTMLEMNAVDEELRRGLGLSMKEVEPFLRAGGDAAEIKFMECCRCLWRANGAELVEPFIDAAFNKLPEKSRCVLFQRMLTIVYVAQDGE
jgi:hypothetical protein